MLSGVTLYPEPMPLPVGSRDVPFFVVDQEGWQRTLEGVASMAEVVIVAELMGFIIRAERVGHA